jgi:hypothetical protein
MIFALKSFLLVTAALVFYNIAPTQVATSASRVGEQAWTGVVDATPAIVELGDRLFVLARELGTKLSAWIMHTDLGRSFQ